jgi:hypothetical protein
MLTELTNGLIPDFGDFLTLIAPIWNPVWESISEILNVLFGF